MGKFREADTHFTRSKMLYEMLEPRPNTPNPAMPPPTRKRQALLIGGEFMQVCPCVVVCNELFG